MGKRLLRIFLRAAATLLTASAVAGGGCDDDGGSAGPGAQASESLAPASTRPAGDEPFLTTAPAAATGAADSAKLKPYTFRQIHMAMPVEISLWAPSPEQAEAAARAAFEKVARVDRLMNDYVPDSEISRLSAAAGAGPVKVSPELMAVLLHARRMWELTEGAFDPTAAPVVVLWREAQKTGKFPDAARLAAARELVGMDKVNLDPGAGTVELTRAGMRLDVGGIAKGYACDLATAALREHGVTATYVQAGGDMVLGDAPPGKTGWEIDVPGRAPETLANTAASISGDTARFAMIDGVRYSHVVDPRTGMGVTGRQMAVVLGPRGLDTDPLSTAGCVMEPAEFTELIDSLAGFMARVFTAPEDAHP